MKKKRKEDIEIGIATAIFMGYMAILTYALLAEKNALALWDTAVFICLLYICKQADRYEKARLRRRQVQRENLDKAMDELEAWRESRDAD
jgi:uncharacterized membrane protein